MEWGPTLGLCTGEGVREVGGGWGWSEVVKSSWAWISRGGGAVRLPPQVKGQQHRV